MKKILLKLLYIDKCHMHFKTLLHIMHGQEIVNTITRRQYFEL